MLGNTITRRSFVSGAAGLTTAGMAASLATGMALADGADKEMGASGELPWLGAEPLIAETDV